MVPKSTIAYQRIRNTRSIAACTLNQRGNESFSPPKGLPYTIFHIPYLIGIHLPSKNSLLGVVYMDFCIFCILIVLMFKSDIIVQHQLYIFFKKFVVWHCVSQKNPKGCSWATFYRMIMASFKFIWALEGGNIGIDFLKVLMGLRVILV